MLSVVPESERGRSCPLRKPWLNLGRNGSLNDRWHRADPATKGSRMAHHAIHLRDGGLFSFYVSDGSC